MEGVGINKSLPIDPTRAACMLFILGYCVVAGLKLAINIEPALEQVQ
jgi:hypothetical protein